MTKGWHTMMTEFEERMLASARANGVSRPEFAKMCGFSTWDELREKAQQKRPMFISEAVGISKAMGISVDEVARGVYGKI